MLSLTVFATAMAGITCTLSAQEVGDSVTAIVYRGDAHPDGMIDLADVREMNSILQGARPRVSLRDLDFNGDGAFNERDVGELELLIANDQGRLRRAIPDIQRVILGDANDDGHVDIADLFCLSLQFTFGARCAAPAEALDCNSDGTFDISDRV